jgi:hypothetical protein
MRSYFLLPLLLTIPLLLSACSSASPSPEATATAQAETPGALTPAATPSGGPAAPTPPLGPPGSDPTGPGPQPGRPCPIDQRVCAMAVTLLPVLSNGQIDALVAMSEPVAATCPSSGFGIPSPSLCQGAAAGEVRPGYWAVQGGEGLIVPEEDWRRTLQRWSESIRQASGNDVYGPGALRVGSVSCSRPQGPPSGQCIGEMRINFTFINAPSLDPTRGTGIPGQRTTFHISLHAVADGSLKVDGFGNVVPPNSVLLSFRSEYAAADGRNMVVEYYPWTP